MKLNLEHNRFVVPGSNLSRKKQSSTTQQKEIENFSDKNYTSRALQKFQQCSL